MSAEGGGGGSRLASLTLDFGTVAKKKKKTTASEAQVHNMQKKQKRKTYFVGRSSVVAPHVTPDV